MLKINVIQKKILVGGENLFEKAQQQQFMLETTDAEIQNLDRSQQQLEETLQKKGVRTIINGLCHTDGRLIVG